MESGTHVPVLLEPVLEGLDVKASGCYVDATFGRGGHSRAILDRLSDAGRLIAIDRDPAAVASANETIKDDKRFEIIRGDYAELEAFIAARGLVGCVDGVLMDLGVSSPQLDEAERGFSFLRDGPLDMRMDPGTGTSAAGWLASVEEKELRRVLKTYGEEKSAARIARAIVAARETAPLKTTVQLADIVAAAAPAHGSRKHPATKTFQAIRIVINNELGQLEDGLRQAVNVLAPGGRLCVISFHSLEDRIVKRFMRDESQETEQYRGMPDVPEEFRPRLKLVGKQRAATAEEIDANARARSARLRVAERAA
ncbi:MAG: 16S rRNA (cytosine(1402)-N(4))-methyltransferase RsmH [Woeseiaceae bacterium]|nr:16S rRNA (cytosine(1402)-N(4))-methyltransferase RsmH [Woeseiaceae bacterium]